MSSSAQRPRTYHFEVLPSSATPCTEVSIHEPPGVWAFHDATSSVSPKARPDPRRGPAALVVRRRGRRGREGVGVAAGAGRRPRASGRARPRPVAPGAVVRAAGVVVPEVPVGEGDVLGARWARHCGRARAGGRQGARRAASGARRRWQGVTAHEMVLPRACGAIHISVRPDAVNDVAGRARGAPKPAPRGGNPGAVADTMGA